MYDIPKALGHRRISLAVRQRLIMDVIAFAKNLQPNEGNKYYSIYPITEFLSAEHVNPSQHPEAVKFLEEVTPSIFSWSGETALEFAFLAIKALAIAKSPFANTLFLRWLRNIEPSGGGALRYAVILAADNRFRSLTLPARYIRGWLNATGSDDFIPLLAIKVIGSANYSEKVRAELVALIDQRPGLSTEERAMILLFMAHGEFPDSEIRRRADDLLGKEPNAPIIRLMALASAVIRPKLYPDLLKLMDRLVPDDESYKSTFLGLRIFATLVAPLSDSERARRLDTALRDEHFNEETLSQLSPSLVRTLNIQHVDRYLELVKKLRQHPLFTDDLRKEYLNEVTQDEDDSSYTIGPDLTDAQKQAIRDALSGGQ